MRAPSCRHDGAEFTKADKRHRIQPGKLLPAAALIQLRGDWEWYATCFRFRMASQPHFCWKCDAERTEFARTTL